MGLPYHPKVGEVLWCDYKNLVPPEMEKKRLAIVISPKFINRTDLCTVVPISTTAPKVAQNYHHRLEADPLPTSPEGTVAWAKCDMVMTVSFGRLSGWWGEKKDGKRIYQSLYISDADLIAVKKCVLFGIGMGSLTEHVK